MIVSMPARSLHHASHLDTDLLGDVFRTHPGREKVPDAGSLEVRRTYDRRQTQAPASLGQLPSQRANIQRPPCRVEDSPVLSMRTRTNEAPEKLGRPTVDRDQPPPVAPDRKGGAASGVDADVHYAQISYLGRSSACRVEQSDDRIPAQNLRILIGFEGAEAQVVVRARQITHTSDWHEPVKAELEGRSRIILSVRNRGESKFLHSTADSSGKRPLPILLTNLCPPKDRAIRGDKFRIFYGVSEACGPFAQRYNFRSKRKETAMR
jgi:hypothetical protein